MLFRSEPTEGLDRETERQVLALLLAHCQQKTLIMVTHRLTGLEQFDQVIVMDNAQVVEQGDFTQLSQTVDSLLFKLVNRISY